MKGAAGSLVVLVNWLGAWAVSYTYNFLMTWSSYGKQINVKKLISAIYSQASSTHCEIISIFIVSRKRRGKKKKERESKSRVIIKLCLG